MIKLDRFLTAFELSEKDNSYLTEYEKVGSKALENLPELNELFSQFSGASFDNGLFKIHTVGSFYFWTNLTFNYFRSYKNTSHCFAFDWLGRQYAINYSSGKTFIVLLDPASSKSFKLECDIQTYLSEELDYFKNEELAIEKFIQFRKQLAPNLKFSECLGFKLPLFLGGKDEFDNYEVCDTEVYWDLTCQMYLQTKDLPPSTKVNFEIE